MNTDYNKQAIAFLEATGTSITIAEAIPQKSPIWAKDETLKNKSLKHGIHYSITLENKKHKYTFDFWGSIADREMVEKAKEARERGIYSADYAHVKDWIKKEAPEIVPTNTSDYVQEVFKKNIVEAVKALVRPTAYDILACLSPLYEDNFEDFCASYGYDVDSITALKTYEAVKEQDYNLHKLFTHEEIKKLAEIQ